MRRPRPESGDRAHGTDEVFEACAPIEAHGPTGHSAGERANRACAGLCQSEPVQVGVDEFFGRGKGVRQSELLQAGREPAVPLDEPCGDSARRADGDLLADDRAHTGLERIPGPGRS